MPRLWTLLFPLLALVLTPTARADQAAVESVMADMCRAVLAGDGPGYLRFVDRADAIFLKEQENWAKDLETYVPLEFTLTIERPAPPKPQEPTRDAEAAKPETPNTEGAAADSPKTDPPKTDAPKPDPSKVVTEPVFNDDDAQFTLTIAWKMPKASRTRKVTFPVRFVRRDGRWLFAGEEWQVVERPADTTTGFRGVRVRYFKGMESIATRIADAMPEVRAHVDEFLGIHVPQMQEVKLYKSMAHLQESIYLSYTDGLGGWNEPGESIKFLGGSREMGPNSIRSLLAHEYGHVATFAYGPQITDAPWWFVEGIADLCSSRFRTNPVARRENSVLGWARNDRLAPWDAMDDFRKTDRKWMGNVYTQGEHMAAFISDQFGDDGRNRLLAELGREKNFRKAFQKAFGYSFDLIDAQWRAAINEQLRVEAAGLP